jgi:very-short-patch-repair endonuclease
MATHHRYRTAAPRQWAKLKHAAREHRKEPTPAEKALWQGLRNGALGARFRREHVIDGFIVDFVCLSCRLVIEVDGGIHDDPDQQAYDAQRTAHLVATGFTEIRFRNEEVLGTTKAVLAKIRAHLKA